MVSSWVVVVGVVVVVLVVVLVVRAAIGILHRNLLLESLHSPFLPSHLPVSFINGQMSSSSFILLSSGINGREFHLHWPEGLTTSHFNLILQDVLEIYINIMDASRDQGYYLVVVVRLTEGFVCRISMLIFV